MLTEHQDDFGSFYIAGHGLPRRTVLTFARNGLERIFTRVILDPAQGLVMLMTPSKAHEAAEAAVAEAVEARTASPEVASDSEMRLDAIRETLYKYGFPMLVTETTVNITNNQDGGLQH